MRKYTVTTLILSMALFACETGDEVLDSINKKAKFTLSTEVAPQKLVKLTNGRTLARDDGRTGQKTELIVKQGDTEVLRQDYTTRDTVEIEPGSYEVTVEKTIIGGIYDGMMEFKGTENYNINEDEVAVQLRMYLTRYAHDVQLTLVNLPGAKAWVGPEGFEIAEHFEYIDFGTWTYGDAFDIVIEYNSEQKRYTTEAAPGLIYLVTITNDEEEPTEKSSFFVDYDLEELSPEIVNYKW